MFFILLSVLALALFSTAVAYILYFRLIQNVGSTKALTVTYLIPVFALGVGCSHPEGANHLENEGAAKAFRIITGVKNESNCVNHPCGTSPQHG